jgi:hypothetical protein
MIGRSEGARVRPADAGVRGSACRFAGVERLIVVVSTKQRSSAVRGDTDIEWVEQLDEGDRPCVLCCRAVLQGFVGPAGDRGDMPLVRRETLVGLAEAGEVQRRGNLATVGWRNRPAG